MNVRVEERMSNAIGVATETGMFITNEQLARLDPDLHTARKMIRQMLMDLKDPKVIRGPTAKPANVRIAGPKDELAVYDLVLLDLEENAKVAPIDPSSIKQLIMQGTRKQGGIVAVIDGPDGKPVAVQILTTEKWWWSKARHISKVVDFVHPDHRQSMHAQHLIQFAKWVADQWTVEFGYQMYLLAAVLGTKRTRDKVRAYGRRMTNVGGFFIYPYPLPWD